MKDDAELLMDYAKANSEAAFAELVTRHIPLVHSAALRLLNGDVHLAQDVTQSVFTDLARKSLRIAKRFSARREALPGWLHTSTRFAAATAIRANQRRRKYEEKAAMSEPISISEGTDPDWEMLRPVLDEAMGRLSVSDRDAVILRFFQGEELKRIGAAMGITEDAARMRINRALECLRGLLEARGVTLSTSVLVGLISANAIQAIPPALGAAVATAAAGAATMTGLGLFTFMTTKIKVAALAALIIAGAGTPLVLQQQSLSGLRQENRALLEQREQAMQLRAENERLASQILALKNSRPRSELLELMRLRSEVGLLRKDSQELARLRSNPQAYAATDQPVHEGKKVLRAEEWANVGMETPDAALQTFFWAARHNDADLVGKLIRWQKDNSVADLDGLDEIVTSLIPGSIRYAGELESMTLLGTTNKSDGTARIQVELAPSPGKPAIQQEILFVQEEGLWKPVFNVWSPRKGSIQGSLAARTPLGEKL
jgi:RNA polymerase sigma factor (sigma-70 family)